MKLTLTARQVQIFAAMVRATDIEDFNAEVANQELPELDAETFAAIALAEENELDANQCIFARIISEFAIWDVIEQEFEERFPAAPVLDEEIEALIDLIWNA